MKGSYWPPVEVDGDIGKASNINGSDASVNPGYHIVEGYGKLPLTIFYSKKPTMTNQMRCKLKSDSTLSATREEQRTSSTTLNDTTGLNPKGYSVVEGNGCKRKT